MINRIYHNDCMSQMSTMPDDFIDCIVTDPPYGIGFMGKDWDKALPSIEVWKECLRVLKPGAFAFIMSIPRQDCLSRMIVNLEDAGFMVNFSPILWTYATGFPKAANLSKLADKRAGAEREVVGKRTSAYGSTSVSNELPSRPNGAGGAGLWQGGDAKDIPLTGGAVTAKAKELEGAYAGYQPKPCYEVILVAMKPCTEKTYLDQALKYVQEKRCVICGYDEKAIERETHRLDCGCYMCDECLISGAALDHEHKPHKSGGGCSWLDDGRIPYETSADKDIQAAKNPHTVKANNEVYGDYSMCKDEWVQPQGRFAPNLLVSDDALNDGRTSKSSGGSGELSPGALGKNVYGEYAGNVKSAGLGGYGDSGSYSRYFSLDAWAEKNLPESVNRTFPFMIVPKPSKKEKNAGLDELEDKQMYKCDNSGESLEIFGTTDGGRKPRKNTHATVKPTKLMSYLIAIGSRPGDVVYDPYMGSGTTGIACALTGRHYIGTETDAEMVDIGERRIKWHVEQAKKEAEAQMELNLESEE